MGKFFDIMDKTTDLIVGNSPSRQLEDKGRLSGRFPKVPAWYLFFLKKSRLLSLVAACLIIGGVYLFTGSRDYISNDGLLAVAGAIMFVLAPFYLIGKAVAAIQQRLQFREVLNDQDRVVYDESMKKRARDFIVLFIVTLAVTVAAGAVVYYGFLVK